MGSARVRVIERHPHPKYPRLSIQRRSDSRFYQAITYLDGKLRQASTRVTHLPSALKIAEDWYRKQLRASVSEGRQHPLNRLGVDPTLAELVASYKATVPKSKRDYVDMKWSTIADYWRTIVVTDVNAQTFRDFYTWRRRHKTPQGTTVKNHTLHKDMMVIRQVLKYAIEEGHLNTLPPIPKVGRIVANPRPWLTRAEWKHLVTTSNKRIQKALKAENGRVYQQRLDAHEMAVFMVLTMLRVGEMRELRFRNCEERTNAAGEPVLVAQVTGKRGTRTIVAPAEALAIIKRRWVKDATLVFPEHHREAFKELLKAANLYHDSQGFTRNFKSLRATAISFRLLDDPNPNLLMIARNAGTSVQMIDAFYARRLSAEMHLDQLSKGLGVDED